MEEMIIHSIIGFLVVGLTFAFIIVIKNKEALQDFQNETNIRLNSPLRKLILRNIGRLK